MQQRSIVVLIVATALPAPVRPEPFWQRWQDSVIERLGVNYSSYVAAQVHKFDRKVVMNPEGSLDTDAQSKKTTSEHAGKFGKYFEIILGRWEWKFSEYVITWYL